MCDRKQEIPNPSPDWDKKPTLIDKILWVLLFPIGIIVALYVVIMESRPKSWRKKGNANENA